MKPTAHDWLIARAFLAAIVMFTVAHQLHSQKKPFVQSSVYEQLDAYLKGKAPLQLSGDIFEQQRQQIMDYFQREIAGTPTVRNNHWQPDFS